MNAGLTPQQEADLVVMDVLVTQARQALAERDWEKAHGLEDSGHMLITRRAATGESAWVLQQLAMKLIPLCETDYPRHCA